ncbi:MAG: CPBP family intramembrane metalloprotease [Chloroflexota bacterium]|nr:CPBP family intramembrane metalloprotease [Chloroflexota bacterium]
MSEEEAAQPTPIQALGVPGADGGPPAAVLDTRWPSWPAWLAIVLGALLLAAGAGGLAAIQARQLVVAQPQVLVWGAVAGASLIFVGLAWLAVRGVLVRRWLPPTRYRGPSVFLLLFLALFLSTAAAIPFSADASVLVLGGGQMSRLGSLVLLTSTQVALIAVTGIFVLLPNALHGLSFLGRSTLPRSVGIGLGFGLIAWVGATLVSALAAWLLKSAGIPPEPQAAEQALSIVDPLIAVPAVVIVAPIAEELFFRGVVFNAWLREHGYRRALLGSSLLFALIHGSLLALLPIFVLGIGLALVYERTRSLLASIVMHATVNGISVALALAVRYDLLKLPV